MGQSVCFVINTSRVYRYDFHFNNTMVGQASDLMKTLTLTLIGGLVPAWCLWLGPPWLDACCSGVNKLSPLHKKHRVTMLLGIFYGDFQKCTLIVWRLGIYNIYEPWRQILA